MHSVRKDVSTFRIARWPVTKSRNATLARATSTAGIFMETYFDAKNVKLQDGDVLPAWSVKSDLAIRDKRT